MKTPSLGRSLVAAGALMGASGAGCSAGALGMAIAIGDLVYVAADAQLQADEVLDLQTRCNPDQEKKVALVKELIYEDRQKISEVFGEMCSDEGIECTEGDLVTLIEGKFGTPYTYCSSADRISHALTNDGHYVMQMLGQALAFSTDSDVGAYTLFPADLAQGPCSTARTVLHEEAHVASGMIHEYDETGQLKRDWIDLAGDAAGEVCQERTGQQD